VNFVIDSVFGFRGPTRLQESKLKLTREKITLLEEKRGFGQKNFDLKIKQLRQKERILQLQALRVFTVFCRHHLRKKEQLKY
jgi:hypothetical protein